MASADYEYEDGDRGWVLTCGVEATVVGYVPARTNCRNEDASPAEGGYLEDVTFTVTGFKLEVGSHVHEVALTPLLAEALALEVKKAYDADDLMQAEVYALFED
jgi:hypothetical protein